MGRRRGRVHDRDDRPVVEPHLAHPSAPRWPAFSPPALEAGVRGVFGFLGIAKETQGEVIDGAAVFGVKRGKFG